MKGPRKLSQRIAVRWICLIGILPELEAIDWIHWVNTWLSPDVHSNRATIWFDYDFRNFWIDLSCASKKRIWDYTSVLTLRSQDTTSSARLSLYMYCDPVPSNHGQTGIRIYLNMRAERPLFDRIPVCSPLCTILYLTVAIDWSNTVYLAYLTMHLSWLQPWRGKWRVLPRFISTNTNYDFSGRCWWS